MSIFAELRKYSITSPPKVAAKLNAKGISNFGDLAHWLWQLPYGRNKIRSDYSAIIDDERGTCSTKHGFLKYLAQENGVPLKLMHCTFEMNSHIDKRLASFFNNVGVDSFLECHCYLMFESERFDITFAEVAAEPFALKTLSEAEISIDGLGAEKVEFHRKAMHEWLKKKGSPEPFESVWKIREDSIKFLGQQN